MAHIWAQQDQIGAEMNISVLMLSGILSNLLVTFENDCVPYVFFFFCSSCLCHGWIQNSFSIYDGALHVKSQRLEAITIVTKIVFSYVVGVLDPPMKSIDKLRQRQYHLSAVFHEKISFTNWFCFNLMSFTSLLIWAFIN